MGDKDKNKNSSPSKLKTKSKYRKSSRAFYEEEVMGKAKTEGLIASKERKKRERWLLTRKTWRYMADAGRKLIPEGAHNRPEDIPKIEAYFQEVCHREPRFLLWRKQSYPGALGFRNRGRSRGGRRKIGGSCRDKTSSADEADDIKQQAINDPQHQNILRPSLLQLKQEFLFGKQQEDQSSEKPQKDALVDNVLSHFGDGSSKTLDHQELLDRLTAHLASIELKESHRSRAEVQDSTQQQLIETLRRYYSRSTNRDKVISDILTDRRLLHRLYFELRRTRGFIGGRAGHHANTSAGTSSGITSSLRSSQWRRSEFVEEDEDDDEAGDEASPWSSPPEVRLSPQLREVGAGTQTETISSSIISAIEAEVKKQEEARKAQELLELQQQQQEASKQGAGRRSSVDNDDVSPSVSDTIKRYLRMARKKSIDSDKADRFKRINYDRTLRNIKAKPEDPISKDDGPDKGCQTDETWVSAIKELKLPDIALQSPQEEVWNETSPPLTSKSILSSGQTFLSNLFHGLHHSASTSSVTTAGAMQKSKSSSSVVHQGTRLVAKKMWKSRSKSQTRATPTATSTWTPQGNCVWTNVTGRTVMLEDTSLLQLTDIERRVLQKVALAKLQALNLGVAIRTPSETVSSTVQKPKRRAHLLKRKAITTGFFDTNRKDPDKEKDSGGGGLVFGIPLSQCVENERAARLRAGSGDETNQLRRKSQYGSRTSFTSLIETPRSGEEKGSCESLISPTLSMPGLLDSLSCGSTQDLSATDGGIPNIVTTCLRHLEMHGLHTLGIFRVSSSKKRVRQLREDFDCGKEASLDAESCPHDVATLLKEYFRDLPDSLLCKDLYPAFIQTQRIRNRRLQQEALQNLICLLPVPNRDTLWGLLNLLSLVANNSADQKDNSGQWTLGNKMDSNNLATLFAPNILHSCSTSKSLKDEMSAERSEERADAINVVRYLIDNYRELYQISAEVLNEVYIHMMDSHPEVLDVLFRRKDVLQSEEIGDEQELSLVSEDMSDRLASHITGDSDEHISNEDVRINKERRVWSREKFTHETAGMGGPDIEVRPRHKDRGRERILKKQRWRDESSSRRRGDSDTGSNTPSRRTSATGPEDYSSDQINSSRGSLDSGAITAVLKIPVPAATSLALNLDDSDIPFIEDNERQQISLSMVRATSSSSQRTRSHSGSDSSQASTHIHHIQYQPQSSGPGYDSAVGSSAALSSPPRITTPSASSYSSGGVYSSPPSWASTPPTSPDGLVTNVNYIPEEPTTARISIPTKKSTDSRQVILQRVTVKSAGEVQHVKSSYIQPTSSVPETARRKSKDGTQQRLLSIGNESGKVPKSASSSSLISYPNERIIPVVREGGDKLSSADRKITTSISSIGGAVLRSKTADIERMIKTNASKLQSSKNVAGTTSSITALDKDDDKKQSKRRYTDVRHQTKHLPSHIASETSSVEPSASNTKSSESRRSVVWKRREIISSEPKERRSFV